MNDYFFIAVIITASLGYYIVNLRLEKSRTASLRDIARQLGLKFSEKNKPLVIPRYNQFPIFSQGHSKQIINRMYGDKQAGSAMLFGYKFKTGHGKNEHTNIITTAYIKNEQHLPVFELHPETLIDRIKHKLGRDDINFLGRPEFSRRFVLIGIQTSGDIPRLFSRKVTDYLEKNLNICIESNGYGLIIYRSGERISTEQITQFHQQAKTIYKLLQDSAARMPAIDPVKNPTSTQARQSWANRSSQPKPLIYFVIAILFIGVIYTLTHQLEIKKSAGSAGLNNADTSSDNLSQLNIGWAHYQSKEYEEAIEIYSNYINNHFDDAEGFYYRALAYIKSKEWQLAENDLLNTVRLDPEHKQAYLNLDYVLYRDKRYGEIIQHWTDYLQHQPDDAEALLERGGAYHRSGNKTLSLVDAERACELGNSKACSIHRKYR